MHQNTIVLITGASSGLGLETARQLASRGAAIIMISRDPERGRLAEHRVSDIATGHPPTLLLADLSSQNSVRALAAQVRSLFPHIDVLINNAGAVFSRRQLTVDGIEQTFALNHLAPFLLTQLLFDLVCAAPSGRVINISSEIHSASLDFDNLQGEKNYNFLEAYNRSKLENILFTYELARRSGGSGVTVNSVSPGPTRTHFGDNLRGLPRLFPLFMKNIPFLFVEPEVGARGPVYLASSPDVAGLSGRFFLREREIPSKPVTYNEAIARRLWEISEQLTSAAYHRPQPASASLVPDRIQIWS